MLGNSNVQLYTLPTNVRVQHKSGAEVWCVSFRFGAENCAEEPKK